LTTKGSRNVAMMHSVLDAATICYQWSQKAKEELFPQVALSTGERVRSDNLHTEYDPSNFIRVAVQFPRVVPIFPTPPVSWRQSNTDVREMTCGRQQIATRTRIFRFSRTNFFFERLRSRQHIFQSSISCPAPGSWRTRWSTKCFPSKMTVWRIISALITTTKSPVFQEMDNFPLPSSPIERQHYECRH